MAYLTGITYDDDFGFVQSSEAASPQSSCFVASVLLDDDDDGGFGFDDQTVIGDPLILQSCQALASLPPGRLIVVGNTEPGYDYADPTAKMTGMALELDRAGLTLNSGLPLAMSSPDKIPYPVDVLVEGPNDVYVISLTSSDAVPREIATAGFPNWTTEPKYGTSLDMAIHKVSLEQEIVFGIPEGEPVLTDVWSQEFPIDDIPGEQRPRVYIGGAITKTVPDSGETYLLVAGSTRGEGDGYGLGVGQDEDGFVSVLNPDSGELATEREHTNKRCPQQWSNHRRLCNFLCRARRFCIPSRSRREWSCHDQRTYHQSRRHDLQRRQRYLGLQALQGRRFDTMDEADGIRRQR